MSCCGRERFGGHAVQRPEPIRAERPSINLYNSRHEAKVNGWQIEVCQTLIRWAISHTGHSNRFRVVTSDSRGAGQAVGPGDVAGQGRHEAAGRLEAPQGDSPWAWELSTSLDGRRSWVVCNHPYTVAPSRFSQVRGAIPSVTKADFNQILSRLHNWLPRPFSDPS